MNFQLLQMKLISKEQFLAAQKNLSDGKTHNSRFIKTICDLQWTKTEIEKRIAKVSKRNDALLMCTPEKVDYLKSKYIFYKHSFFFEFYML